MVWVGLLGEELFVKLLDEVVHFGVWRGGVKMWEFNVDGKDDFRQFVPLLFGGDDMCDFLGNE